MNLLLLFSGIALLIIISIDIVSTILRHEGGGLISNIISGSVWKIFFSAGNKRGSSRVLDYAGVTILVLFFLVWALGLWLGYSLIFLADPDSVVMSGSKIPSSAIGKIYFVGFTLTSLGIGDLVAGSDGWRIFTIFAALQGLFFLFLAISYYIPVLNAITKQRALASQIFKLGRTPAEIIENGWNGKDFGILYEQFITIQSLLLENVQQILAYPILGYIHSSNPEYSFRRNLVVLDEAISVVRVYKIEESDKMAYWMTIKKALDSFINETVTLLEPDYAEEPDFYYKEQIRISRFKSSAADKNLLKELSGRRKILKKLAQKDGWTWRQIVDYEEIK